MSGKRSTVDPSECDVVAKESHKSNHIGKEDGGNLFIVNHNIFFPSTQQYSIFTSFQYNIHNYFATCFGSYEPSSGINFKTYCFYSFCLTVFSELLH